MAWTVDSAMVTNTKYIRCNHPLLRGTKVRQPGTEATQQPPLETSESLEESSQMGGPFSIAWMTCKHLFIHLLGGRGLP